MNAKRLYLFAAMLFAINLAFADPVKIEGVPIQLGNTVEEVQKALGTTMEPEDMVTATGPFPQQPKKTQLRLKTRGIWVFFERGKVTTIRLDQPFPGNIGGVKIGDPGAKVLKVFGKPIKENSVVPALTNNYMYYIDDITTAKFSADTNDEIITIYLIK